MKWLVEVLQWLAEVLKWLSTCGHPQSFSFREEKSNEAVFSNESMHEGLSTISQVEWLVEALKWSGWLRLSSGVVG
jgi:hypothetical protein